MPPIMGGYWRRVLDAANCGFHGPLYPKYGRVPRTRREARARFEEFASLSPQDKLRRFTDAEAFAYSVVVPILKATDAHPMHEDDDAAS